MKLFFIDFLMKHLFFHTYVLDQYRQLIYVCFSAINEKIY